MRLSLVAALVLLAGAAQAQAPLTGTTAPVGSPTAPRTPSATVPAGSAPAAPTQGHRHGHTLQERFDTANVTHDGHLTQEQARAHMPSVARDFADIDKDHKGYVTVDEIRDHSRAVRAAHRAAKKAAAAKS